MSRKPQSIIYFKLCCIHYSYPQYSSILFRESTQSVFAHNSHERADMTYHLEKSRLHKEIHAPGGGLSQHMLCVQPHTYTPISLLPSCLMSLIKDLSLSPCVSLLVLSEIPAPPSLKLKAGVNLIASHQLHSHSLWLPLLLDVNLLTLVAFMEKRCPSFRGII